MKLLGRFCFILLGFILWCACAEASVSIQNMRIGNQSDGARVVFDMNKSVNYRVFLLGNPKRAVVDLDDADIGSLKTKVSNQVIAGSRVGKMSGNDKRIVFDLSRPAIVKKAFLIPPQGGQNWRLVVDFAMTTEGNFNSRIGKKKSKAVRGGVSVHPMMKKPI